MLLSHMVLSVDGTIWSDVFRDLLSPLEEVICTKLLPNLTGQCAFNGVERELLSLPPRLSGLGIISPSKYASHLFTSSFSITAPLVDLILQQSSIYSNNVLEFQLGAKQQAFTNC